jgi:Ni,Fe-hydrogenase III small subunit/Fe-S-cluster-containing hydrogenase component 2
MIYEDIGMNLLAYLIGKGVRTNKVVPQQLAEGVMGFPSITGAPCDSGCNSCADVCPTDAIHMEPEKIVLTAIDRGACIGCGYCLTACPTGTLKNDPGLDVWTYNREELVHNRPGASETTNPALKAVLPDSNAALATDNSSTASSVPGKQLNKNKRFGRKTGIYRASLAIRVVSTGCSACDLELAAASNPIFDMDRFGIQIVASPRFADVLLVTGPVPKAMHEPLRSCYKAMAEPKLVIACGTCAISGGVHANGYTQAQGVGAILPVDVFIPGCPPHPWQIIKGIQAVRNL